ncbi:MAG: SDR family NAD(P)-dependent oxidoreductase [Pseudomonadota bacterium]
MSDDVRTGRRVAIVGATGGIGAAIVDALAADPTIDRVYALSRSAPADTRRTVAPLSVDLAAPETIAAAAQQIAAEGALDLVIVATGLLHDGAYQPEKDWRQLEAAALARAFEINTIGPALVAQAFLPLMPKQGRSVFAAISAKVGSISDNRIGGWYGYRASKAALNMMIKSLAIELVRKKRETICVALHPGTVDTDLSKPFQSATRPGQVVPPETSAANLLSVIAGLTQDQSGALIAWDGAVIAP